MKSKASLAPFSNSTASHEAQSATFQPASDQDAEEDLYYLEEENEIHADSENEARPLQDQIEKPFSKKELNNTSEIAHKERRSTESASSPTAASRASLPTSTAASTAPASARTRFLKQLHPHQSTRNNINININNSNNYSNTSSSIERDKFNCHSPMTTSAAHDASIVNTAKSSIVSSSDLASHPPNVSFANAHQLNQETPSTCGWCQKQGMKLFTLRTSEGSKVFCSELCFTQCRRASFKKTKVCNWCKHVRHTVNYVEYFDGKNRLQFCSEKCLDQYKINIVNNEINRIPAAILQSLHAATAFANSLSPSVLSKSNSITGVKMSNDIFKMRNVTNNAPIAPGSALSPGGITCNSLSPQKASLESSSTASSCHSPFLASSNLLPVDLCLKRKSIHSNNLFTGGTSNTSFCPLNNINNNNNNHHNSNGHNNHNHSHNKSNSHNKASGSNCSRKIDQVINAINHHHHLHQKHPSSSFQSSANSSSNCNSSSSDEQSDQSCAWVKSNIKHSSGPSKGPNVVKSELVDASIKVSTIKRQLAINATAIKTPQMIHGEQANGLNHHFNDHSLLHNSNISSRSHRSIHQQHPQSDGLLLNEAQSCLLDSFNSSSSGMSSINNTNSSSINCSSNINGLAKCGESFLAKQFFSSFPLPYAGQSAATTGHSHRHDEYYDHLLQGCMKETGSAHLPSSLSLRSLEPSAGAGAGGESSSSSSSSSSCGKGHGEVPQPSAQVQVQREEGEEGDRGVEEGEEEEEEEEEKGGGEEEEMRGGESKEDTSRPARKGAQSTGVQREDRASQEEREETDHSNNGNRNDSAGHSGEKQTDRHSHLTEVTPYQAESSSKRTSHPFNAFFPSLVSSSSDTANSKCNSNSTSNSTSTSTSTATATATATPSISISSSASSPSFCNFWPHGTLLLPIPLMLPVPFPVPIPIFLLKPDLVCQINRLSEIVKNSKGHPADDLISPQLEKTREQGEKEQHEKSKRKYLHSNDREEAKDDSRYKSCEKKRRAE